MGSVTESKNMKADLFEIDIPIYVAYPYLKPPITQHVFYFYGTLYFIKVNDALKVKVNDANVNKTIASP